MNKNRKKGFTLIELIAVLVILAIIALIVTPLVMNIVKKAKDSANKRSVDAYGKAVELAVTTHLLDNGDYPTDISSLTIEYSGNEVVCNIQKLNEDGSIYLSECNVNGVEVKDSKTDDGYYHYGKTTNIVITYHAYNIGDVVTYNDMNFYVIAPSDESSDRVTLLKADPLTVEEVNIYGIESNGENHINRYVSRSSGTAYDSSGYGGILYYTSTSCGFVNSSWQGSGCTTDYTNSEIKYVVDAWALDKLNEQDLETDDLGYKTRLLTLEDLTINLGYFQNQGSSYLSYKSSENTPSWMHSSDYDYWTMSAYNNSNSYLWYVNSGGYVDIHDVRNLDNRGIDAGNRYGTVRPVITLSKTAI